ncbi:MAG: hypothetical protein IPP46_07720 [Bacteroidetes bacterium]|nr:hypothetical protein [Bacteroidota bacterium]
MGQNVIPILVGWRTKELEADTSQKALHHELCLRKNNSASPPSPTMEMVAGVHPDLQIRFSTSNLRI